MERGRDWIETVNREPAKADREAIETSERRGRPLGNAGWTTKMAHELGLGHTVRREGRPAKVQEDEK